MTEEQKDKSKVVDLPTRTVTEVPVEKVLTKALQADLEVCVVMGFKDGEFYGASSTADGGAVLFLMELLKRGLLDSSDYVKSTE